MNPLLFAIAILYIVEGFRDTTLLGWAFVCFGIANLCLAWR
jgi:hypothetical protein